LSRKICSKIK